MGSNDFSDNPYVAPPPAVGSTPMMGPPSTVQQVMVVSIMQIVQGSLELMMAVFYGGYMLIVGLVVLFAETDEPPPPEAMTWIVVAIIVGTVLLATIVAAAVMRIIAGIGGLRFRRRTMGIVASCLGLVSGVSCYCLFTALGLLVYSLIIYLDAHVRRAYERGERGETRDQILAGPW